MACLKDLKISEIKKLKLVYYVQFGMHIGNYTTRPYVIKFDCIERKKDFYKDYWLDAGFSYDEDKIFTSDREAEHYIFKLNNNKKGKRDDRR